MERERRLRASRPKFGFQEAAVAPFEDSTPLFKVEGDAGFLALIANIGHPLGGHRAGTRTGLTADNDPVNTMELGLRHGAKERLEERNLMWAPVWEEEVDAVGVISAPR